LPNEKTKSLDINSPESITHVLKSIQGLYSGYFVYEERRIKERFSIILRHARPTENRNGMVICGYGENDEMGNFLLNGSIKIMEGKITEKPLKKNSTTNRVKLARFNIVKTYVPKHLEELNDEKIDEDMYQGVEEYAKIQNQAFSTYHN
jgi:hypothetical protein